MNSISIPPTMLEPAFVIAITARSAHHVVVLVSASDFEPKRTVTNNTFRKPLVQTMV